MAPRHRQGGPTMGALDAGDRAVERAAEMVRPRPGVAEAAEPRAAGPALTRDDFFFESSSRSASSLEQDLSENRYPAFRDHALAPHAFRHFFEHDLGRAAADRMHARIARHALDRAFAHVAHAAVKLHAGVHHLVDELAAIRLHHRHLAGAIDALRVE